MKDKLFLIITLCTILLLTSCTSHALRSSPTFFQHQDQATTETIPPTAVPAFPPTPTLFQRQDLVTETSIISTLVISPKPTPFPTSPPFDGISATPTFLLPTLSQSPTPYPVANLRTLAGNLGNQIDQLEENMPRAGSEGFTVPTNAEKAAFSDVVSALKAGDVARAEGIAASSQFELIRYTDHGDGDAESYLLRELKPIQNGWGLFVFRIRTTSNVIIEAPHPLADEDTPHIAMEIYRTLKAQALLIAGAHRDANRDDSADVAHASQSIFQAIHETLIVAGTPVVLQIHGFSANRHPGYPQVVLGHDRGMHTDLIDRLATALTAEGVQVGVCDGDAWQDLCGETNVQSSTMDGGAFIHIELDETMRKNDQALITALIKVLTK